MVFWRFKRCSIRWHQNLMYQSWTGGGGLVFLKCFRPKFCCFCQVEDFVSTLHYVNLIYAINIIIIIIIYIRFKMCSIDCCNKIPGESGGGGWFSLSAPGRRTWISMTKDLIPLKFIMNLWGRKIYLTWWWAFIRLLIIRQSTIEEYFSGTWICTGKWQAILQTKLRKHKVSSMATTWFVNIYAKVRNVQCTGNLQSYNTQICI